MKKLKNYFIITFILCIPIVVFLGVGLREKHYDFPTLQVEFFKPKTDEIVILGFAGEIILARDVALKINQYKDVNYPFLKVSSLTSSADLFFATLEAPLFGENSPCGRGCMRFVGDEKYIEGLKSAGIDVVSLAANHIMDGGEKGLEETLKLLDKNSIAHTGAGLSEDEALKPVIKEIKKTRFGFIGFNEINPKTNTAGIENLTTVIANLKRQSDVTIVSFHWGIEYTVKPTTQQKELAHKAIESGADLVIGDHPHWVQAIEFYQGKPIFYSVGNFVFDQMWSTETKQGIVVLITFIGAKPVRIQILPHQIEDSVQPRFLNKEEGDVVLKRILSNSDPESVAILKSFQ